MKLKMYVGCLVGAVGILCCSEQVFANTIVDNIAYQSVASSYTSEDSFGFDASTGQITNYTGSDTVVNIPPTINGITVVSIGNGAFSFNRNITSVTVPSNVRSIGSRCFNKL